MEELWKDMEAPHQEAAEKWKADGNPWNRKMIAWKRFWKAWKHPLLMR